MKQDLRIIKTKNNLFLTLLSLMKNNSIEEIKVSDICNKAMINRSTFYAHYNDKYELLIDCLNNIKSELIEKLATNVHILNTKNYYLELIRLLLDTIDENRDLYFGIMVNNQNNIVMDIVYDVAEKDIKMRLLNDYNDNTTIPATFISRFYLGAIVSIVLEYLKTNKKYPKDKILEYLNKLIPEDIDML